MQTGLNTKWRGFTLIELIVVMAIIGILVALLIPVVLKARENAMTKAAQMQVNAITIGLEKYKDELYSYPPDSGISSNGSEIIWYYTVRRLEVGETHYGPYTEIKEGKLRPGSSGNQKLISPFGGDYEYVLIEDEDQVKRSYKLVDPGKDKNLGGSYVTTGPTAGTFTISVAADEKDNIYSSTK